MTNTLALRHRTAHRLLAVVGIAALADAVTTWVGLHGAGVHESNGVAASVIRTIGLVPVLGLRILIPLALFWAFLQFTSRDRVLFRVTTIAVAVLTAGWFLVAVHNVTVIR